jgi:hypothetical protein
MKNVISFPGSAQKTPKTVKQEGPYLILSEFDFTCPVCKIRSKFEQKNLIFKRIEFFCSGCGNCHSVTNPGFSK